MGIFDNRSEDVVITKFNEYVRKNGLPDSTKAALKEFGQTVIPREPPPGLLNVIVTRLDPSFMSSSSIFNVEDSNKKKLRYQAAVNDIRHIYAEIAGTGYYSYDREADLVEYFNRSLTF